MDLSRSAAWSALESHRQEIEKLHMREMFERDANRFERLSIQMGRADA